MEKTMWRYRAAGAVGGILLAAGQFWGLMCISQLLASGYYGELKAWRATSEFVMVICLLVEPVVSRF